MFTVPASNLQPHMFTYRPVDVTSRLTVPGSVCRRCKCCAGHNNIFCVFCLATHPASNCLLVALWCSSDDNTCWVLNLGLLSLNSQFHPSCLSYITTPRIILYLVMVFQSTGRIVHPLVCSWVIPSSRCQCWTQVEYWYFGCYYYYYYYYYC